MSAVFSNEVIADVTGTVSVAGNVTVVQPTGTNLHTVVDGTVAVTGPLTDAQLRATPVPVTLGVPAGTPTVTRVAVSPVVATIATANSARKRVIIHNEAGILFVKLGTVATDTDYTYRLTANTMCDIDFSQDAAITAIKASGASNIQVTEII